ncbi:MAG: hypothetical protein JJU33_00555 [Phycisphaerales bacterium]|nr:hypothetical protein [Phycisphaerales bacterium]
MPIDSASTKASAKDLCPFCSYDRTGLPAGDRCPECGKISRPTKGQPRKHDLFGRAPLAYLRRVQLAMWTLALGALVATVSYLSFWYGGEPTMRVVSVIASAMYFVGVWVMTAPRESPALSKEVTRLEFKHLRWVNRGTQSLWFVSHGLAVLFIQGYVSHDIFRVIVAATFTIAAVGLVPFSAQLAWFARWACDDGVASRLNASAWGLGLPVAWFGLLTLTGGAPTGLIGFIVVLVSIAMFLSVIFAVFIYLWSCVTLAGTTSWAIRNWHDAQARDQRERDRAEETARKNARRAKPKSAAAHNPGGINHAQRDAEFEAAFSQISKSSDTPASAPIPKNIHRIERRSDDDPIPLEPE